MILNCARVSILINESPVEYFLCSCGIRHNDHLSPFLFGIAKVFLSMYLIVMVDS